ncbi:MAG: (2Fe-2S)-binding protein [Tomitella sp.]|nr:(2Fe-2S)-binding protein [Tomitella sp.]
MPRVYYHHLDGHVDELELDAGARVMQSAVANGIDGIVGECGGQLMCATCHVYVREEHLDSLPHISEDEEEMLEETAAPRDPERSRLSCQLVLGDDLDELHVDVPEQQV